MYFCYLDEAGCLGKLNSTTDTTQPTFTLVGLVLASDRVPDVTRDLLQLKERFFPQKLDDYHNRQPQRHFLDGIQLEIKGSEVRKNAASEKRRERRHATGFLEQVLRTTEKHNAKLFSSTLVKGVDEPINSRALYTNSVQTICDGFNAYLKYMGDTGIIIADSRNPHLNKLVAHSIFTQMYRAHGDAYPHVLEMPVFGHSDNHAGLQIADLMASAFVTPAAIDYYCTGIINNVHVRPRYSTIRERFTHRLKGLQYRFKNEEAQWRGGIHVSDKLRGRKTGDFLRNVTL